MRGPGGLGYRPLPSGPLNLSQLEFSRGLGWRFIFRAEARYNRLPARAKLGGVGLASALASMNFASLHFGAVPFSR